MADFFATNRLPSRKKSILAEVYFGAKKGLVVHTGKMNFYLN